MTIEEQKEVALLKIKLEALESKLQRLQRSDNNSHTAQVARSFHLGMVGGSGRNTYRLNKRREREIEKTIANAKADIELTKEINRTKAKIHYIETGQKEKDAAAKEKKNRLLADWFSNLKPGDTIQPGNNPIVVTKVNKKSIITENDCKWNAAELIGPNAARLL